MFISFVSIIISSRLLVFTPLVFKRETTKNYYYYIEKIMFSLRKVI